MRKLIVGLIAVGLCAMAAPAQAQTADPLGLIASGAVIPYVLSPGINIVNSLTGTITNNVLAGGRASRYPQNNFFPSVDEFEHEFVDFRDGDFRLAPTSRYRGMASDGGDLGANLDDLERVAGSRAIREPRDKNPRPPKIPKGGGGS